MRPILLRQPNFADVPQDFCLRKSLILSAGWAKRGGKRCMKTKAILSGDVLASLVM
jgi:hypothetical protein